VFGAIGVIALVACGGGNQVDEPATFKLLPDDLVGAPCTTCREGYLVGVAADGAPLDYAEVLVIDATGKTSRTRTDAQGRYAVAATGLSGPLLVQVSGSSSAEPVVLHSLAVAVDVSNRAVNVTPLTELISAFVLGGTPQELLQQGRVDFMRVNAASLRSNQDRVKNLVQPALLAAQAQALDLRTGHFAARYSGLDGLGALIEVQRTGSGYSLRSSSASGVAQAGILVDPVASSTDALLAPQTAAETSAAQAALAALPEIEAQLQQFSQLFSSGLPSAAELQSWMASGFRHTGLDAQTFIATVLLRPHSEEPGQFGFKGARFDKPRLLQVSADHRVLVRVQVTPAHSAEPHSETFWMIKSGGRWQWQGDGQAGLVRLRHLAVLGAKPRERAELLATPGMRCQIPSGGSEEQCAIEGGSGDVPAGGMLDFGNPNAEQFGLLAYFRSDAATWQERLNASRSLSRLSAAPSAQISKHLVFEVDSQRLDPRIRRVRVNGPGLPEQGLDLAAPSSSGKFRFLALSDRPEHDWHAVRTGRCAAETLVGISASACQAAWAKVGLGSRYSFSFFDQDGKLVQTQTERLASQSLSEEELLIRKAEFFARFDVQAAPTQQPLYARVLDPSAQTQGLAYSWAWQRPTGAGLRLTGAAAELQWANPLNNEQGQLSYTPALQMLLRADGAAVWDLPQQWPGNSLPFGAQAVWLTAKLSSTDAMGNRYLHYIAPNNPY
jgi:hypothetical protein